MNGRAFAGFLFLTAVVLGLVFLLLIGMLDAHLPTELGL